MVSLVLVEVTLPRSKAEKLRPSNPALTFLGDYAKLSIGLWWLVRRGVVDDLRLKIREK